MQKVSSIFGHVQGMASAYRGLATLVIGAALVADRDQLRAHALGLQLGDARLR